MTQDAIDRSWNYGDAGDRWQVAFGDVWSCGPHILACGDLAEGDANVLVDGFGKPDFAYVDPPWNKGNARAFRTKAHASTPEIETGPVDFKGFLDALVDALSRVKFDCFVEMGHAQLPLLKDRIEQAGGDVGIVWDTVYYRRHPSHLVHCWWNSATFMPVVDFTGMDDEKTPFAALNSVAKHGKTVFDPCIGRGLTAMAAESLDLRVIGLELNPRRLAVAIDRLATLGHQPERMGKL